MAKYPFGDNLKDIAKQLQTQIRELHERELQGEAEQIEIKNDLQAKKDALRQLATFPDEYAKQRICFQCWLEQFRSPLEAIGGGTPEEDFFSAAQDAKR